MRPVTILALVALCLLACEKKPSEPDELEYLDLNWIWVAESETYDCADDYGCDEDQFPGIHRDGDVYYRGETPDAPSQVFEGGVDWISYHSHKCKWIHYHDDEEYIEFEEVGEDQFESEDFAGMMIAFEEVE